MVIRQIVNRAGARVADLRSPDPSVRTLTNADAPALLALIARNPLQHAFVQQQLDVVDGKIDMLPGARILGRFDDAGTLVAACWVGANVVPVTSDQGDDAREHGEAFGRRILTSRKRYASIFGPKAGVEGIWSVLKTSPGFPPRSVRLTQPFMTLEGPPAIEPSGLVRQGYVSDFDAFWPASVAMFTEELGYSPLDVGEASYRARVKQLLACGHTMLEPGAAGTTVRFKAELGIVTREATQIQGVWMHPDQRELGLSPSRMAAVVELAQAWAPVTTLYVNDYNHAARTLYKKVGFQTTGTFATILL